MSSADKKTTINTIYDLRALMQGCLDKYFKTNHSSHLEDYEALSFVLIRNERKLR